jgi:hypothetical protein
MFRKNIYWILVMITVILSGILPSCKKFTEIAPPKNAILGIDVFTDSLSSTAAILGIYTTLNSTALIGGNATTYLGLSADELNKIGANNNALQLQNNLLSATNDNTGALWASAYQVIAQANACLTGLKTTTAITPVTITQYSAEAKFLRAFSYFYLVNLYGDVPLVITNDYQLESNDSRKPVATVYQQIVQDLTDAQTALPVSYASGQYVRATKWAAAALLARVYLYQQNWAGAETQATSVINNSGTSLTGLSSVFVVGSSEAIWQVQQPTSQKNAGDFNIIYNYGYGYYMTNSLLNAFETGDARKTAWIFSDNSSGSTLYYPYKYKADAYSGNTTEYTMMLRLAEQYLIRAEARARQNKIPTAVTDLNVIRNRAGLANLPSSLTRAQCIAATEQERRIELFAEWGHRWLDLKRTPSLTSTGKTRADDVLGALKGSNWQSTDQLYPIPYNDIKLNGKLTQNAGY